MDEDTVGDRQGLTGTCTRDKGENGEEKDTLNNTIF